MSETTFPRQTRWEERWHPLREEWVVIAAHRQDRPWIGETVSIADREIPAYQADCYLCPGNSRVSGAHNPDYTGVYVFDNDHPCVGLNAPEEPPVPQYPYRVRPARGLARVICYSPAHNLTLAEMALPNIEDVVSMWQTQTRELQQVPGIKHLLFFENRGEVVGVSNPHPHGQIYATNFVFKSIETELFAAQRYQVETGQHLFSTIISAEQRDGRRVLYEDEHSIAFVPYFARYAYEVYVAPKRRVPYVSDLNEQEVVSLARALKNVTVRFDNLWQMPFPYVMALHQAPNDGDYGAYHFFIAFHPPLRQPSRLKYLAGPEIGGGNFISDTLPEEKAAELLQQATVHYREQNKRNELS
ncbi:galactose-1-phosphate uridylyltransferase [Dictyobacter aurantiacus]|uniref:Galactose-1-phosphate uridylyltransferase n=1 Tax=Dictyobacter aurantiacus TaxID=1936993 RepID=A0A401ZB99_9CHLR|nr:galactose-1-phosphate uridylyltransferase [Dictyobacter aurantiacus]GCE04145.1 galactose-1-phosphate uridylyltransferase [Dictyobacter aurantiacus]